MYVDDIKIKIEKFCAENKIELINLTVTLIKDGRSTNWHPDYRISCNTPRMFFQIHGLHSGCGLVMLDQFTSSEFTETTAKIFSVVADAYKGDGAGSIIATLGDSYDRKIELWGFKKLEEYCNHRHGRDATQRLFIRNS